MNRNLKEAIRCVIESATVPVGQNGVPASTLRVFYDAVDVRALKRFSSDLQAVRHAIIEVGVEYASIDRADRVAVACALWFTSESWEAPVTCRYREGPYGFEPIE